MSTQQAKTVLAKALGKAQLRDLVAKPPWTRVADAGALLYLLGFERLVHLRARARDFLPTWKQENRPPPAGRPAQAAATPPSVFDRFVPQGHFYSPVPDLDDIRGRQESIFAAVTECPGVELNTAAQLDLLASLQRFYDELPFAAQPKSGLRYSFENEFYSYSDGIFLYLMLRHLRPRRYLEIGSGYSSALVLDVNELFLGGALATTFIEPYPERLLSLLRPGEESRIALIRKPVQQVDLSVFAQLQAGDVLFIDSTHVAKVGSDVNFILFHILPTLRSGVFVHFHDIFFPFEYPKEWVFGGRAFSEAYLLRAFLQYNSAFEVVLFNTYLAQVHEDYLAKHLPLCLKNKGGSIWLRKR